MSLQTMAKRRHLKRVYMTRDELRVDFIMFSIVIMLLLFAFTYIALFSSHDLFTRFVFIASALPTVIAIWIMRYVQVQKVLRVAHPRWQKEPIRNDDGGERE